MLPCADEAVGESENLEFIGLLMIQPPVQASIGAALTSLFQACTGLFAFFALSERRGRSGNLFKFKKIRPIEKARQGLRLRIGIFTLLPMDTKDWKSAAPRFSGGQHRPVFAKVVFRNSNL